MRKVEFEVPSEVMAEFAAELAERDVDNKVVGTNDDDEIIIEVMYEKEETDVVDELEAILDKLREGLEEGGEDDDDDDN